MNSFGWLNNVGVWNSKESFNVIDKAKNIAQNTGNKVDHTTY